jgi:hypothetical protein
MKRPTIRFDSDSGAFSLGRDSAKFEKHGKNRIFRPREDTEQHIFGEEAAYVLARFKPGTYKDRDQMNLALQTIFAFHKAKLEEALSKLATRNYISFLMWQYDQSHDVLIDGRRGILGEGELEEWAKDGPIIRRAFKYLIERVCSLRLASEQLEDEEELLLTSETAQVCAEEFVRLSALSDSTFAVFPTETELTIHPIGPDLFEMKVTNQRFNELGSRGDLDGKNRHRFLSKSNDFTLDQDKEQQDKYLGDSFEKVHGIRFSKAIELLGLLVDFENPTNKNPFDGCFFFKREVIAALSNHLTLPLHVVETVFSGFTIKPDDISEKPGHTWNPKRSYGANKRALFEVPHKDGICLAWSRRMVGEALYALLEGVVFHKFPQEWMRSEIKTPLDTLDNYRGKWFESVAAQNLVKLGFMGRGRKDKIGSLIIPKAVGEIDHLGYSEKEKKLVVIECKMTQYSSEPRMWRDDLDKYVKSDKSYAKQFRNKRDWILENLHRVCEALSTELKTNVIPGTVATAMITSHPNIASCFIEDFPCVSLTELMLEAETINKWPYELGTFPVES